MDDAAGRAVASRRDTLEYLEGASHSRMHRMALVHPKNVGTVEIAAFREGADRDPVQSDDRVLANLHVRGV